jgi:Effector Associated Constant Component 1
MQGAVMTHNVAPVEIELMADSPDDLDELYSELRGVPGIAVTAVPAPVVPGEQGAALDVLMVALSSGTVTAFLQIIKVLAESHGPKFSLKIRQGKNRLEVTADSIDEVLPVIRELMDGS